MLGMGEQETGEADDGNDRESDDRSITDEVDEISVKKTEDSSMGAADDVAIGLRDSVFHGTTACKDSAGEGDELIINGKDETANETEFDIGAPDGGWGWLVLIGCFTVNFISDGCAYSFGVLFTELLNVFGETKSKTSWVGSLFFSVPLLCGPIASVITTKIGCRRATIVGGVIAVVGLLASSFVQSVESLYFTYGILAGFGMSLPYLTSILVLSYYFKKRLAFATGVAECGAGIGTIVFAPLTEVLLSVYAWRGAMYIIAAIAGHIIVSGALFRPPTFKNRTITVLSDNDETRTSEDVRTKNKSVECTRNDASVCSADESALEVEENVGTELDVLCSVQKQAKKTMVVGLNSSKDDDRTKVNCDSSDMEVFLNHHEQLCKVKRPCAISVTSHKNICGSVCHKHWKGIKDSMKFSIFQHPIFLLFITSNFILYFWFDVPFVFLANRAVEGGMTESEAALLVSVIGVLHTLGNLLFGILGDRENLSLPLLYGISIAVCGASLMVVPSFSTFVPLALVAGTFGLFSAASEALSSILLIDILGEGYLSQSYGFTMFLKGVANLVGPPVAGWLFDESGSYDNTFYASGVCLIIAGLMYVPTPVLRRCQCTKSRCATKESQTKHSADRDKSRTNFPI